MQNRGSGGGTLRLVGFCLVGCMGMDVSAQAADYAFKSIVDNGPGSRFGSPFATAISSNGLVAFLAFPPGFGFGMYSSPGGNPTPILETLQAFGDGGINSSGTVAFILEAPGSDSGVYTGFGGPVTSILKADLSAGDSVSINDSGMVAFTANQTLMIASGGTIQTIVESRGKVGPFGRQPGPINNQGRVVYGDGALLKVVSGDSVRR